MNTGRIETITEEAIIGDENGYNLAYGVGVYDLGETLVIGASEHQKSDLIIEGNKITSKIASWNVTW